MPCCFYPLKPLKHLNIMVFHNHFELVNSLKPPPLHPLDDWPHFVLSLFISWNCFTLWRIFNLCKFLLFWEICLPWLSNLAAVYFLSSFVSLLALFRFDNIFNESCFSAHTMYWWTSACCITECTTSCTYVKEKKMYRINDFTKRSFTDLVLLFWQQMNLLQSQAILKWNSV